MNKKYIFGLGLLALLFTRPSVEGLIPIQKIESDIPTLTYNISSNVINNTNKINVNETFDDNNEIVLDPMPISNYKRPYEFEKVGLILRAKDGSSYITPENEVVQWFVKHTEVRGTILYYNNTNNKVVAKYLSDHDEKINDYWMNADYYLSHGLEGDCEDYAIAMASILEAKNIPNMIVMGSTGSNNSRHCIVEYYINNDYYIMDTYYSLGKSRNLLIDIGWKPKLMFNITTDYSMYNYNWATN